MRTSNYSRSTKKISHKSKVNKKNYSSKSIAMWDRNLNISRSNLEDLNEVLRVHKLRNTDGKGSWKLVPKDSCEVYKDKRKAKNEKKRRREEDKDKEYDENKKNKSETKSDNDKKKKEVTRKTNKPRNSKKRTQRDSSQSSTTSTLYSSTTSCTNASEMNCED